MLISMFLAVLIIITMLENRRKIKSSQSVFQYIDESIVLSDIWIVADIKVSHIGI